MEKLKINPNNKKYYSEEFIKGFECGVERQFNADTAEKTAEWIKIREGIKVTEYKCSACGRTVRDDTDYDVVIDYPYCHCGCRMKGVEE